MNIRVKSLARHSTSFNELHTRSILWQVSVRAGCFSVLGLNTHLETRDMAASCVRRFVRPLTYIFGDSSGTHSDTRLRRAEMGSSHHPRLGASSQQKNHGRPHSHESQYSNSSHNRRKDNTEGESSSNFTYRPGDEILGVNSRF